MEQEVTLPVRGKEATKQSNKPKKASTNQPKGEKANKANAKVATASKAENDPNAMFKVGFLADVYNEKPSEKVVTRFPPEPNGYLHIGHSKAIAVNFGFARYRNGICYLRYDDTNPAGEREEYFLAIKEMIEWLGFEPVGITYSSDNFDRLWELAEILIRKDEDEIQDQRGGGKGQGRKRYACPHRNRPAEESINEFRAMRDDCLCDSFEGITHSLCTTEFELSRVSYEWLCDKLEVYKPMQREYGRLNVTGTVLSKRKIIDLIEGGYVSGWDDPRLYTLIALRRRGVPPGAILSFVNELGVTKAKTNIETHKFEQSIRRYLENTVPRLMMVLEPLKVVIDNLNDDFMDMVELPFSKDPSFGVRKVPFTKTVFIERSDFREEDSKDYFRLAPGKTVGLMKVPFPITATSFDKDNDTGLITCVHAKYEQPSDGPPKKAKTFIHWVSECSTQGSPLRAEVRAFDPLFKSADPLAHPSGSFLNDINPKSLNVFTDAMIEIGFHEVRKRAPWPAEAGEKAQDGAKDTARPESVRFQGMRVAYFAMDKEASEDKLVFNRIVTLKEDVGK
ncbi:MAG: hypothetical protein Q9227_006217 [Pyrenula ochraceoflavens]